MKTRRIVTRAIIAKDDKLLLVCHKIHDEGAGRKNDFYCTPGGGLNEGESLVEGVKREVIEETGITPKVGRLLFIQQYKNDVREYLEFFFHVTNAEDFENVDLSLSTHGEFEIEEIGFYDLKKINILPQFLQDIDPSKIDLIDEVKVFSYLVDVSSSKN